MVRYIKATGKMDCRMVGGLSKISAVFMKVFGRMDRKLREL
jgi:hypothetical protein